MCGNAEMWKCGNAEMQHFWMGFGFEFVRLTKHIRAIIADHLVENGPRFGWEKVEKRSECSDIVECDSVSDQILADS